jgi:RHS repeat-associated protein
MILVPTIPQGTGEGMVSFYSSNNHQSVVPRLVVTYTDDVEAPNVIITSPARELTLSGDVNVTVTDLYGHSPSKRVDLYAGNTFIGSASTLPFQLTWDTLKFPDGDYKLEAKGIDSAGNLGSSKFSYLADSFNSSANINIGQTTASLETGAGRVYFRDWGKTLVSSTFNLPEPVKNASLSIVGSQYLNYYLSADGGVNWEYITPNTVTPLQYPGSSVVFKATGSIYGNDSLYSYQLTCEKSNDYIVTIQNQTSLSAPSNLTSQTLTGGKIQLNWTAPAGNGITYRVYRSTTLNFTPSEDNLTAGGFTANSYLDESNLINGTTYYYRVIAVSQNGLVESPPSNETSIVCTAPPNAPVGLKASPTAGDPINLAWNNYPVSGVSFKIYRSTTQGFTPGPANLLASSAVNSYTDTNNLVNGTSYFYRVTAVMPDNTESPPSNESGTICGSIAPASQNRLGVRSFWTYAGFSLAKGDGMVNIGSGNLVGRFTDTLLPGNKLITEVSRTYNSMNKNDSPMGFGWSLNILQSLTINPNSSVTYNLGDGHQADFIYDSGNYQAPPGFYLSLVKNADNSFTITRKDNIKIFFDPLGNMTSIKDLNNNTITYSYTGSRLTSITDTIGRTISISYDANGRISSIDDPRTNPITYSYDTAGNLAAVTDPMGFVTRYSYDINHNLTEAKSPAGVKHCLTYDNENHPTSIIDGLGNTTTFTWNLEAGISVLTDPRGNTTTYNFDPSFGHVTSIVDALGNESHITYDANYNPLSITDPGGHSIIYTYDGMGNMLTRQDAAGTYSVAYNSLNLPVAIVDPRNGITTNTYDSFGNLTASTDPMNYTTTYQYDNYGRRTQTKDPRNGTTVYDYDSFGNLTGLTNANNHTTSFTYNNMGIVTSITDPLGEIILYTYDDLGRLIKTDNPDGGVINLWVDADDRITVQTDPKGGLTRYGYDAAGRVVSVTSQLGNSTVYQYDPAGNRTRVTDPEGKSIDFSYDALNRLVTVTDMLNNSINYQYDVCGNMTEIVHPTGHSEFQTYDALHRKISSGRRETSGGPDLNITTYTYDSMNNLLSTTDPMSNTISYTYDLNNRLVSVTNSLNNITTYGYDACGNRVSVTNANNHTTTLTYDLMGNITQETQPGNSITSWTYDPAERVSTRTDSKSQITRYSYDRMGRLLKKSYSDFTEVSYIYDNSGNRLLMKDSLGTSTYRYDSAGQLLEVVDCLGRKVNYTYDSAGRRSAMTTSFGTQTYEYDNAARLCAVTDFKGNQITLAMDADNKITEISYPQGGTVTYTYNNLDQVTYIDGTARTGAYYRITYNQYDLNGNCTQVSINGTPDGVYPCIGPMRYDNFTYTYDQLNRLTSTSIPGQDAKIYTYDNIGNRLSANRNFLDTDTYIYDDADRLLSRNYRNQETFTYEYDNNGNQKKEIYVNSYPITNDTTTNQYDCENRIVTSERRDSYSSTLKLRVRYLYNGDGQLMGVLSLSGDPTYGNTTGGSDIYYLYDGNQVIADLDGAGGLKAHYTRTLTGKMLSTYNMQTSAYNFRDTYYVFTDALGSTVMLFGKDTGYGKSYSYEEFGKYACASAGPDTRFTFTGAPYFSAPGLYQMGARYYNPNIGRFITQDTYRGNIYEPWTQNLYTYCNNNPVNYVDPTGHFPSLSSIGNSICNALNNFNDQYIGGPLNQIASGDLTPIKNASQFLDDAGNAMMISGDPCLIDNAAGIVMMGVGKVGKSAIGLSKAVNLPSWRKIGIDIEHIASGHMKGGSRVSDLKNLFPEYMDTEQVEKAVREAYKNGAKVGSQNERALIQGTSNDLTIEMWVNTKTKTIETAYPKFE